MNRLPMSPSRLRETVSVTEPGTWVTGRSASLVWRLRALSPHSLFQPLNSNLRAIRTKVMIWLLKHRIFDFHPMCRTRQLQCSCQAAVRNQTRPARPAALRARSSHALRLSRATSCFGSPGMEFASGFLGPTTRHARKLTEAEMQIGVETSKAVDQRRVFVIDEDEITRAALQFMLHDE